MYVKTWGFCGRCRQSVLTVSVVGQGAMTCQCQLVWPEEAIPTYWVAQRPAGVVGGVEVEA